MKPKTLRRPLCELGTSIFSPFGCQAYGTKGSSVNPDSSKKYKSTSPFSSFFISPSIIFSDSSNFSWFLLLLSDFFIRFHITPHSLYFWSKSLICFSLCFQGEQRILIRDSFLNLLKITIWPHQFWADFVTYFTYLISSKIMESVYLQGFSRFQRIKLFTILLSEWGVISVTIIHHRKRSSSGQTVSAEVLIGRPVLSGLRRFGNA